MQVDKKVMDTHKPASFNINITLKSSPDLLTYFCQAASSLGVHGPSARLQMYWELWASECWGPLHGWEWWALGKGREVQGRRVDGGGQAVGIRALHHPMGLAGQPH
jgi:hypothetical protein